MADSTLVKPEIKVEPAMADMEEFEEDTDLQIPPAPSDNGPSAWLVKLPSNVWQAWNDLYHNTADETPIEIGKMRVYNTRPGEEHDPLKQRIQIRLTPGVPQHQNLPLNYDLTIKTNGYSNIAVFSEKDLPGHRNGPRNSKPAPGLKPSGIQSKTERYGAPRKPGTYRTTIPKQTALAPMINHVADAAPVLDASYDVHFHRDYQSSLKPKQQTTFYNGIDRGLHPGTNLHTFSSFGLTSRPVGSGKARKPPPKEKAVRISEQEMLDALYRCFRQYRYWSIKTLREQLRQPEAFIKQMLEQVGVLMRSGDFAGNWKLKEELAELAQVKPEDVKEEMALIKSEGEGSTGEDGEDEGEEFEDVEMEAGG